MAVLVDVRGDFCRCGLHFIDDYKCGAFLLCLFAICMSSLEKMSFETFGPFLNEVGFLFAIQLYEFLYILGINPLQNI